MSNSRPPWLVVIKAHVAAQPKKSAVLGILFVVMVVIYARMFVLNGGPSAAVADTPSKTEPRLAEMNPTAEKAQERIELDLERWPELPRDPFMHDVARYPIVEGMPDEGEAIAEEHDPRQHAIERARRLRLSSIMWQDGQAIALIGDRIVSQGDEIEGFIVEKVEPTRVLLARRGLRVVLKLPATAAALGMPREDMSK